MPNYDYKCKKCSHTFEVFHSMTASPVKACPKCGSKVRRLISGGAGFIFKGPGFYATDYRKPDRKKSKEEKTTNSNIPDTCKKCKDSSCDIKKKKD